LNRILITGLSGFVGTSINQTLSRYYKISYSQFRYIKGDRISLPVLPVNIIIHLAGKAHDLKNVSNPEDYYEANYELTKQLYDVFLESSATVFVFMSSVKAAADEFTGVLTEEVVVNPGTHYGKSKLMAEQYILSKKIPEYKRVYLLRPCMIHGPRNKGNLNLLYKLVSKGIPWPLGAFENKRSYCSIDNMMFIFEELIMRNDIPSGIYNVADDEPLSTNQVISILGESENKMPRIWNISKRLIEVVAKIGNVLKLPLNEERLQKLTDSYVVSNKKLINAIGKPLPVSSREGLLKTFKSFQ